MKYPLLIFLNFVFLSCQQKQSLDENASRSNSSPQSFTEDSVSSVWSLERFPLRLHVSSDFYADEAQVIRDMGQTWNDGAKGGLTFLDTSFSTSSAKGLASLSDFNDPNIGIYPLFEWPKELSRAMLGVTQIMGYRRHIGTDREYIEIDQGDIFLNFDSFEFTVDGSWGYSLRTLILHEMGHLLGLDHDLSSEDNTVMYPYLGRSVKHTAPTARDIETLQNKYGLNSLAASPKMEDAHQERVVLRFELYANGSRELKVMENIGLRPSGLLVL